MISIPFDLSSQSYEIYNELKARKILEKYTDYYYTFDKNPDKYGFDLLVFRYTDTKRNFRKDHLGYIEVECAVNWDSFYPPSNWYCVSFLKRKFYNFDFERKVWASLKKDFNKTIYLKFNHPMDNCFCRDMIYIIQHSKNSVRSKENDYLNSFIELNFNQVCWGIKPCVCYIMNFFVSLYRQKNKNIKDKTDEIDNEEEMELS